MIERLALTAMGTRFELALSGASPAALRAAGEAALDEVTELHRLWSCFDPGSLITRVNRLAGGRAVGVDGDTFKLLRIAHDLWAETEGVFDPTLGARMRAWGFRGDSSDAESEDGSPGMDAVELDREAGTVRFLVDGLELDLGAIAKGYALDRAAEVLRESEVPCALLHGGTSSVVAIGTPPDAGGWPIALDDDDRLPRVLLRDAALAVSAGTGRTVPDRDTGQERGHLIDPRTGDPGPVEGWAAVVACDATRADGWATALAIGARPTIPDDLSAAFGVSTGAVDHQTDPRGAFFVPRSENRRPREGRRENRNDR